MGTGPETPPGPKRGCHWPKASDPLTEPLSLPFSAGGSLSFEVLAVSVGAAWEPEEPPWDDLLSVSVFTSASASCWGAVAAGEEERSACEARAAGAGALHEATPPRGTSLTQGPSVTGHLCSAPPRAGEQAQSGQDSKVSPELKFHTLCEHR